MNWKENLMNVVVMGFGNIANRNKLIVQVDWEIPFRGKFITGIKL